MIVLHSYQEYGKVDVAPGRFHVRTVFACGWFIPILPKESVLVVDGGPLARTRIPIPLRWKSVFLVWMRCLAVMVLLFGQVFMLAPPASLIVSIVLAGATYLIPGITRLTPEREKVLSALIEAKLQARRPPVVENASHR